LVQILTENKQKPEIKSLQKFSKWGTVKHGVPQRSILGPLLFVVYINHLPPTINTFSEPVLFADDTSVIIPSKNFDGFFTMTNTVLPHKNK
jgi:hypothetical protein